MGGARDPCFERSNYMCAAAGECIVISSPSITPAEAMIPWMTIDPFYLNRTRQEGFGATRCSPAWQE